MKKFFDLVLKYVNLIPTKILAVISLTVILSLPVIPAEYKVFLGDIYHQMTGISTGFYDSSTLRDEWVQDFVKRESRRLLTEEVWDPKGAVYLIELIESKPPISEKNAKLVFFLKLKYRAFFYEEVIKEE